MDHKKLQDLSENELTLLCQEIREQLIDQMSRNGGFLADNLSAVDIVVYLNQTFENHVELLYSSERISFAQKYLENQGRSVSCHENVMLAQAMGIAAGLKAQNKDIPIVYLMTDEDIVDFNIIKQLDSAGLKMTIIYLDRQDKDVNALNKLVNDLRQTDVYTGLKKGVKKSLSKVRSSEQIITGIHKIKDSLKKTLIDEDIFSKCNVDYLGPIDGHAPNQLKKAFQNIRKNRRLVVLHCLVKPGKGYAFAEKDETLADRTLPFNRKDGRSFASENDKNLKPYTIINRTIQKIMEENESVFCIGNGSFASNGMANVFAAYPERCLKVKLDEEELLKLLKGMMETGMIPVAAIDPEVLDKYPIQLNELALPGKGLLLYTKEEENLPCRSLNDLQDLYLIQPKDGNELQKAVYTAIDINKPVIIITQPQSLAYE